jgi:hypothetical protein
MTLPNHVKNQPSGKLNLIELTMCLKDAKTPVSHDASQFAMQNSGIATSEVEVHSSFAIPNSVK